MKVLVAAASRHGSTELIADCIHEELEYSGCQAELADPDGVTSLADYDAVVLGSAVYAGHWLKPAKRLVTRLEGQLRGKPVWLFSSGPISGRANLSEPPADAAEISARLGAKEHRVFDGRIERDQLGFGERLRLRGAASSDDRDWLEIGRWARSIATSLHEQGSARQAPSAAGHAV